MNKHCIIGTAGHVDHGKTALIKALTGIDADRLAEEKKRGITIDLGFAYIDLPNGTKAGIVDVPGHEKFIKNMLAGVGGMDLVLLVVAADDGFMPQTREHLSILSLLNIKDGIIVITKTDLVDDEWLEIVCSDVRDQVHGTFLADAPMVQVSANTGAGIDELRKLIFEKLEQTAARDLALPFRLPVDRVFLIEGFGTVVTGTLISGRIKEGDEVSIYPRGTNGRVRRIQVHNDTVPFAEAGQRVALNIAGIKSGDIDRGDEIAKPQSIRTSLMLDVKLKILNECDRLIKDGSRLHFYHGTRDTLAKLVLVNDETLTAGQEGFAQLRFSEPVAVKNGDRFVLRFYSPLETIGGGTVLLTEAHKHKKSEIISSESYALLADGTPQECAEMQILLWSDRLLTAADHASRFAYGECEFNTVLSPLLESSRVIKIENGALLHREYCDKLGNEAKSILAEYHSENPLDHGMPMENFRSRLMYGREPSIVDAISAQLAKLGFIKLGGSFAALPDFQVEFTPAQQKALNTLDEYLDNCGFEPPTTDELQQALFPKDKRLFNQVFRSMQQSNDIILLAPNIYCHRNAYRRACELLLFHAQESGDIILGQFRDRLGSSRKFAVMFLEYWDKLGITKKQGDVRKLIKNPIDAF